MSRINDIRSRLVALFATVITGNTITVHTKTHTYVTDLSATGKIIVGSGIPSDIPDLCVLLGDGALKAAAGQALHRWTFTKTFIVVGFCPATADTPDARISAATDLLTDLTNLLIANRLLVSSGAALVYDMDTEFDAIDGQDVNQSGMGVVFGRITCTWENDIL